MHFEWDEAKSEACFAQRGFDFAYVLQAFLDTEIAFVGYAASPL